MPAAPRRSRWLAWPLGAAALLGMLILGVVLRVQGNRNLAWPVTRAVVARLATDAGARDLYEKNPALAQAYPDAETFVRAVAEQRVAFGSLPATPDRRTFGSEADPEGVRAWAQGTGGSWMMIEVRRSDGTEAGHAAIGEGVTYLGFAKDRPGALDLQSDLRAARREMTWRRFLAVREALLTEDGAAGLLRDNPGLAPRPEGQAAFLAQARAWRPRLAAAQPPATWAGAEEGEVRMWRRTAPVVGEETEVRWKLPEGAWLAAVWREGRLVRVALEGV